MTRGTPRQVLRANLDLDLLPQVSKNEERVIDASSHFNILSNLVLLALEDIYNPLKSTFSRNLDIRFTLFVWFIIESLFYSSPSIKTIE